MGLKQRLDQIISCIRNKPEAPERAELVDGAVALRPEGRLLRCAVLADMTIHLPENFEESFTYSERYRVSESGQLEGIHHFQFRNVNFDIHLPDDYKGGPLVVYVEKKYTFE